MTAPELDAFRGRCQARVESALEALLPAPRLLPERLHEAMRYAVLGGGKRIRPLLVHAAGAALELDPELLDRPACAVELIHAYSLVHDDLPAMDDDELRRGRLTCHRAFDEATAILVGDALQTLAFQALATAPRLGPAARIAMVRELALASGSRGMAGGQALDLAAAGQTLDVALLEQIHIHKTGALIRAAVRLGVLAGEADADAASDPDALAEFAPGTPAERLDRYAKCIGLAFQIRDDVLDVEGESTVIGKTGGRDQALAKATYPALVGLAEAKEMARRLTDDALAALDSFGPSAEPLRDIAAALAIRQS